MNTEQRRYRRGERGLETQEQKFLDGAKMKRYLDRLSKYFNIVFERPKFRPVFINKRLKRTGGLFCGNKIDIADMGKWSQKDTLWHELLHAIVADNWQKVGLDYKCCGQVEKAVFHLEGLGNHKTYNYELKCNCGYWIKSASRKETGYCKCCEKTMVSPIEYTKLKKIALIKSKSIKVNINRYTPWRYNKKIGLQI